MNMHEFEHMSGEQKIETLYDAGVRLCCRQARQYLVALFQLEQFYVELVYHPQKAKITNIFAFDDTDRLDPYLETIDINPLLQQA